MNEDLRALADEYWEYVLKTEPTEAHMLGDYRYIDQFEDVSREAEDADIAARRSFAHQARQLDASELSSSDLTTLETLIFMAETDASIAEMRQAEFGVDPIFGPQVAPQVVFPQMTVETAEHAELMLGKYVSFARHIDQSIERLREGIASGRVNADFAVKKTVEALDTILAVPVEDSPYLAIQMPEFFTDGDIAEWRERAAVVRVCR